MKPIFAVPAITLLVHRAWTHNSLTTPGIVVAALTAIAHAAHPWDTPFVLLAVFFLAGTRVTKINHEAKEKLTIASKGTPGGEGPRNHVQVVANSLVASILIVMHAFQLYNREGSDKCYSWQGDLLPIGFIANYAAVAADTFSSELGILSKSKPRLITSPTLRVVPKGTNGGVTLMGLGAGLFGSLILVTAAMITLPLCEPPEGMAPPTDSDETGPWWTTGRRGIFMWGLTLIGFLGSVVDSILGGLLQRTVKDVKTGKIVEGEGGARVLVTDERHNERVRAALKAAALGGEGSDAVEELDSTGKQDVRRRGAKKDIKPKARQASFGDGPSRAVENGMDLLDNNQVNIVMAGLMSLFAIVVASFYWDVPLVSAFSI
ncbi:Transmembrane protein 19 [Zalerion maritima]|uniref:Transmembrane protein 19 n=1 Tax=Zalerion maritima TaxID=339359 RepID=A0AAD5RSK5_9PEZI|nr:Transmembrane protein 19 [Zalerion maritima]